MFKYIQEGFDVLLKTIIHVTFEWSFRLVSWVNVFYISILYVASLMLHAWTYCGYMCLSYFYDTAEFLLNRKRTVMGRPYTLLSILQAMSLIVDVLQDCLYFTLFVCLNMVALTLKFMLNNSYYLLNETVLLLLNNSKNFFTIYCIHYKGFANLFGIQVTETNPMSWHNIDLKFSKYAAKNTFAHHTLKQEINRRINAILNGIADVKDFFHGCGIFVIGEIRHSIERDIELEGSNSIGSCILFLLSYVFFIPYSVIFVDPNHGGEPSLFEGSSLVYMLYILLPLQCFRLFALFAHRFYESTFDLCRGIFEIPYVKLQTIVKNYTVSDDLNQNPPIVVGDSGGGSSPAVTNTKTI